MLETVRRAFLEFLTIPSLVVAGFLLLAAATYLLDHARLGQDGRAFVPRTGGVFGASQSTSYLLGTIAASIITVTSITLSLLLIAVQQGAAALTSVVFDQFLRRRLNQFYFGFFIGLALYSLIILATVNQAYNPTFGAMVGLLMTFVALYMLILLIYTTIDQMRPVNIIKAIHDHTLAARNDQLGLLRNTRRASRLGGTIATGIAAEASGFLVRIDLAGIMAAAEKARHEVEIVIVVSIGDHVSFRDTIAEIRAVATDDVSALEQVVRAALCLEVQRDLPTDPAYGIQQLLTIGWTSISSAKSNPEPGLLACQSLRDILARWSDMGDDPAGNGEIPTEPPAPVVYDDNVPDRLMDAFESLAVVASESMQHQSIAEIIWTFASMFRRLPPRLQDRAEDLLLRSLSALGEHVPTSELDAALSSLIDVLTGAGRSRSAAAIRAAQTQLASSIGSLHSRSTRATSTAGASH